MAVKILASSLPSDLWLLPMMGDRTPFQLTQTPFSELNARFSPDGRRDAAAVVRDHENPGRRRSMTVVLNWTAELAKW